jgi:hypothetical protein
MASLEERLRIIRSKSQAAGKLRKSQMPWWATDDIYVRWLIPASNRSQTELVTPPNN